MTTLRGSLIGARIARKADLSEVIESALRNSLLSLLEADTGISIKQSNPLQVKEHQSR